MLTACGIDPNAHDYDRRTCLHVACSLGNVVIVEHVIARGANINATDRWGHTPLADAIREGHLELAKILIMQGARLNGSTLQSSLDLCEMARSADLPKMRLLLDGGHDPNARDHDGRTCMHVAASEGARHIVLELIQRQVDVNAKDRWGGEPPSHQRCATALCRRLTAL